MCVAHVYALVHTHHIVAVVVDTVAQKHVADDVERLVVGVLGTHCRQVEQRRVGGRHGGVDALEIRNDHLLEFGIGHHGHDAVDRVDTPRINVVVEFEEGDAKQPISRRSNKCDHLTLADGAIWHLDRHLHPHTRSTGVSAIYAASLVKVVIGHRSECGLDLVAEVSVRHDDVRGCESVNNALCDLC
jgi:hypothetical protein